MKPTQNPLLPPEDVQDDSVERMWPLDLSLGALAALIMTMVFGYLEPDDPRLLYNRWTYLIAIPVFAAILSYTLRRISSLYVRKSMQLGFLFSAFLHLLMIVLAVRWVIFPHYFPEAFAGVKPERSPIRKTVPEYLFQKPDDSETVAPDWSQPVDAETTSRVVPNEERQLPPLKRSAPQLEIPQPDQPQPPTPVKSLLKRAEVETSKPQPSDAPSKLARRETPLEAPPQPLKTAPVAPQVSPNESPAANVASAERTAEPTPSARQRTAAELTMSSAAPDLPTSTSLPTPTPAMRSLAESMPAVGDAGLARNRSQRETTDQPTPAGAAPAPPTVAVAKLETDSARMLAPVDAPMKRLSESVGAQISPALADTPFSSMTSAAEPSTGDLPRRNEWETMAGMAAAPSEAMSRPRANSERGDGGVGQAKDQSPDEGEIGQLLADAAAGDSTPAPTSDAPMMRELEELRPRRSSIARSNVVPDLPDSGDPIFDVSAPEGSVGLGAELAVNAGILPSEEPVDLASMDLTRDTRVRRDVGGPVTPVGMSIAAVESFNRRVQRTNGGAAPAPAGMVGPATEEAIELGLAYLAARQNDDGSWSLQGHGEDVLLRSDTAATGLCLLAFQGAGYTHRQHQYAPTVARALEFLVNNQTTSGDLYRPENPLSDQNVAFYSHGIASLALCEAYGMTQDPLLKEPAQLCLDYIAKTQHRERGGWRYTPQVSADTSVTGWMMMACKSGDLAGLNVPKETYEGINRWLEFAKVSPTRRDLYVYNPFAPDTAQQGHGRRPSPTMTSVGILMRMYSGWRRDNPDMQAAADYILEYPPSIGTTRAPQRDTYYWYYATQVMFHMGGNYWDKWNRYLNPVLIDSQIKRGPEAGSWDPEMPVRDRWSPHGGRLYVSTMNLLNLEVYYRHLPIYEETGAQ